MSHDNISDIRKILYGDLNPPPQSSADSAWLMSDGSLYYVSNPLND